MKAKHFVQENLTSITEDICKLVSINTVNDTARPGKPFGDGIDKGLKFLLKLGKELGFDTNNFDGYVGEISIGSGNETIGILGHVDVVEGGDGWKTDPFQATVISETIYGRGTVDDKGPLICSLYAMKYLKEQGMIPSNKKIKMIIGTDEERTWQGINYYKERSNDIPKSSIVVDGNFPIIYCEKGLIDFNLHYKRKKTDKEKIFINYLKGGTGRNVVPAEAECELSWDDLNESDVNKILEFLCGEDIFTERRSKDKLYLKVKGIATHAMNPEKGKNALSELLQILKNLSEYIGFTANAFIEDYNRAIGSSCHGELVGLEMEDKESGKLTFNVGRVSMKSKEIMLECNIRYPATCAYQNICEQMKQELNILNFEYEEVDHLLPIFLEQNDTIVKELMRAYQEVTNDFNTPPLAIGGATYARALEHAVAFGPIFPGQEDLTHEANENISISDVEVITEIYIEGLLRLLEQ